MTNRSGQYASGTGQCDSECVQKRIPISCVQDPGTIPRGHQTLLCGRWLTLTNGATDFCSNALSPASKNPREIAFNTIKHPIGNANQPFLRHSFCYECFIRNKVRKEDIDTKWDAITVHDHTSSTTRRLTSNRNYRPNPNSNRSSLLLRNPGFVCQHTLWQQQSSGTIA